MKRLFVIFDGPPSHESGRFIEVEDDKGASHGKDAGLGWEHVSPFSGPDTWRLGPFLPITSAATIAENAIGLFIEAFERMGGTLSHPGGIVGSPVELATGSAVAEVVQGVEADVTL